MPKVSKDPKVIHIIIYKGFTLKSLRSLRSLKTLKSLKKILNE